MKHGGDLGQAMERYGGSQDDWLDLSTGINPHSYPLPQTLSSATWTALPSKCAEEHLLGAARAAYGIPDHLGLVAGPGTQLLISLLPLLMPDGPVSLAAPTYSSHADVWAREGRKPLELSSIYALPADARIVVLVNPNNPDGQLVDPQSLLNIANTLTERNGWLILDEAFADVVPGASLLPHIGTQNVAVLRSFGKFYGLAGLRLGFLAGPTELTSQMAALLESWCLSAPALDVGTAALKDISWQTAMTRQLADEMADLTLALTQAGLSVFGGTTLFALAGTREAARLHDYLAKRHIWTRSFDFAPTWLRFGLPGSPENLTRLADALAGAQKDL